MDHNKQKMNCRCCKDNFNEICRILYKNLFINLFNSYPLLKGLEIKNYLHLITCNNYCYRTIHLYYPYNQYNIIRHCLIQMNQYLDVLCTSRIYSFSYIHNNIINFNFIVNREIIQSVKESMIKNCVNNTINLDSTIEDKIEYLHDTFLYDSKSDIYIQL